MHADCDLIIEDQAVADPLQDQNLRGRPSGEVLALSRASRRRRKIQEQKDSSWNFQASRCRASLRLLIFWLLHYQQC
jgi:hypothetical protein